MMPYQENLRYGPLEMSRAHSPFVVIPTAASALELYLKLGLRGATDYLAGPPYTLVEDAKRGLARTIQGFSAERDVNPLEIDRITRSIRGGTDTEKELEAFNFSLVIFATMPQYAQDPHFPLGFSRRGILAPPFSAVEYLQRLTELQSFMKKVITGEIEPYTDPGYNPFLQRSTKFFEVGKSLQLHVTSDVAKEREEKARELLENLLGDTTVDI